MTLAESIALDSSTFDGTVSVTFTHSGTASSVANVSVGALRKEAVQTMQDALGLESTFRMFSLPTAQLGDAEPRPGDTITDPAGQSWRIVSVALSTLASRWSAICIAQR
jgi:hypothetical protein